MRQLFTSSTHLKRLTVIFVRSSRHFATFSPIRAEKAWQEKTRITAAGLRCAPLEAARPVARERRTSLLAGALLPPAPSPPGRFFRWEPPSQWTKAKGKRVGGILSHIWNMFSAIQILHSQHHSDQNRPKTLSAFPPASFRRRQKRNASRKRIRGVSMR